MSQHKENTNTHTHTQFEAKTKQNKKNLVNTESEIKQEIRTE